MPEKMLLSEVVRATQRIFFYELVHDETTSWTAKDLQSRFGDRASRYLVTKALEKLEGLRHIKKLPMENALSALAFGDDPVRYDFTEAGFAQAETDFHNDMSTKGLSFDDLYTSYITLAGAADASMPPVNGKREPDAERPSNDEPDITIPASDRVVRLDDNAPGRVEAITNIERVEKVLESGSNDLPLNADERRSTLGEIKPLLARLKDGWLRIGSLVQSVTKGSPLAWLSDKLAGTAVGDAARLAIEALRALIRALVG